MATSRGKKGAAQAAPTLDELAVLIREESKAGEEEDLTRALRLGEMLRQAFGQVPRGAWASWLEDNYSGSRTTADRWKRIADPAFSSRVTKCSSVREALAAIAKPKPAAKDPPKRKREAGKRLRALHAIKREKDSHLLIARVDIVKMVGVLESVDLPALGFGDADDETIDEIHAELSLLFDWLDRTLTVATARLSDQRRVEKIRKLREATEGRTPEETATAFRLADKLELRQLVRT